MVLPDSHYPHHPTTGMVTHPAVVAGVVDGLREIGIESITIAIASGRHATGTQCANYLGYESLAEELDVETLVLDEAEQVDITATVNGQRVPGLMPKALRDHPIVNVPTARYGLKTPFAAAVANLARPCSVAERPAIELAVAAKATDVPVTVVDAIYTYTGVPNATGLLLDGEGVVDVDIAVATLFGVNPESEEYLRILSQGAPAECLVEGVSLADVRAELPFRPRPKSDKPHHLVTEAYKLYTRVSGDAFPPQLLGNQT
ncbi:MULTISPECIES: DUF362 domain-containing protein [Haloferax]|nr:MULTISPECIES: DUF362 domain-containing protein [Haloferax]